MLPISQERHQGQGIQPAARTERPHLLGLRLYWYNGTPFSIRPAGEGTWKPPAIVVSK